MKAVPLTDKFIHDLKSKLEKGHIRQVKLAKDLHISPVRLYHWLSRRRNPNGERILAIQEWIKTNITNI